MHDAVFVLHGAPHGSLGCASCHHSLDGASHLPLSLMHTIARLSRSSSQPTSGAFFQLLLLIPDNVYFAFISGQLRRTLEFDGAGFRKRSWLCSRSRSPESSPHRGSAGGELILFAFRANNMYSSTMYVVLFLLRWQESATYRTCSYHGLDLRCWVGVCSLGLTLGIPYLTIT